METKVNYSGMKALVMGLGLNGGGLEAACYLVRYGAQLTVTDLRDEKILSPSIERLDAACSAAGSGSVRYVLGRHEMDDFTNADMVIKNPGVPPSSPYLQAARCIETDISLFLARNPARLIAVTGSKGKSSTASAIHWILDGARKKFTDSAKTRTPSVLRGKAYLGGNITVSPLTFLDELQSEDDVVLELSSWQLGDLKGRVSSGGLALLKPRAAILTAIMSDHMDRYASMDAYVNDKRVIYQGQDGGDFTIARNDSWGRSFHAESRGRALVYSDIPLEKGISGGWLTDPQSPGFASFCDNPPPGLTAGEIIELVPSRPLVPGFHQKGNLLAAGLASLAHGLDCETIRELLGSFPGIEHRLEFFHSSNGVNFYNDSAATIPEAAAAAVDALYEEAPLILVTGGTDKNLDFTPLVNAAPRAKAVILLKGTGSDKLCSEFDKRGTGYCGPFGSLKDVLQEVLDIARAGDSVVLSPGCTSFGMFLNEFDRGRKWKEAVFSVSSEQ